MNNEDISKPFLLSLLAHLVLVLLFTVRAVFFPEKEEPYQTAIRVDIVGLPDKVIPQESQKQNPIPTPTPVSPPKPTEIKKEEVSKPAKKENVDLVLNEKKNKINKIKEEIKPSTSQAIDKLKKKMAIDKIKGEISEKERKELVSKVSQFKGNVLAAGTELTGIDKLQHDDYKNKLDRHVKQFWSLPEWLAKGEYTARVRIFIDSQGMLLKAELIRSSGNSNYDEIVMETVKKAIPYPVPLMKFRDKLSIDGVILGFPD